MERPFPQLDWSEVLSQLYIVTSETHTQEKKGAGGEGLVFGINFTEA
jgi:hypothetical protein